MSFLIKRCDHFNILPRCHVVLRYISHVFARVEVTMYRSKMSFLVKRYDHFPTGNIEDVIILQFLKRLLQYPVVASYILTQAIVTIVLKFVGYSPRRKVALSPCLMKIKLWLEPSLENWNITSILLFISLSKQTSQNLSYHLHATPNHRFVSK